MPHSRTAGRGRDPGRHGTKAGWRDPSSRGSATRNVARMGHRSTPAEAASRGVRAAGWRCLPGIRPIWPNRAAPWRRPAFSPSRSNGRRRRFRAEIDGGNASNATPTPARFRLLAAGASARDPFPASWRRWRCFSLSFYQTRGRGVGGDNRRETKRRRRQATPAVSHPAPSAKRPAPPPRTQKGRPREEPSPRPPLARRHGAPSP